MKKHEPPVVYATEHPISKVVTSAFAQGCGGMIRPPIGLLDGPAAAYGILRGCEKVLHHCQWVGREFYYIDRGYFARGHYDGYYRVTKNDFQYTGAIEPFKPDRWEKLGIEMKPWRRKGTHIVVTELSGPHAAFLGIDGAEWLSVVTRELGKHTDRPIMVKTKSPAAEPDKWPFTEAIEDAWCVVTHSSVAALEAITGGIPAVTLAKCASSPVSWSMKAIESPEWPDRTPWAWALAYQQFTLDEFRNGYAWKRVSAGAA